MLVSGRERRQPAKEFTLGQAPVRCGARALRGMSLDCPYKVSTETTPMNTADAVAPREHLMEPLPRSGLREALAAQKLFGIGVPRHRGGRAVICVTRSTRSPQRRNLPSTPRLYSHRSAFWWSPCYTARTLAWPSTNYQVF